MCADCDGGSGVGAAERWVDIAEAGDRRTGKLRSWGGEHGGQSREEEDVKKMHREDGGGEKPRIREGWYRRW